MRFATGLLSSLNMAFELGTFGIVGLQDASNHVTKETQSFDELTTGFKRLKKLADDLEAY